MDDQLSNYTIALFLFIFLFISLIVISIPKFIRSYRLFTVAKFFGLSFSMNRKLFLLGPKRRRMNIINGEIDGHSIEVFDVCEVDSPYLPVSQTFRLSGGVEAIGKINSTIINIDGRREKIHGVVFGYASVKKIKQILSSI